VRAAAPASPAAAPTKRAVSTVATPAARRSRPAAAAPIARAPVASAPSPAPASRAPASIPYGGYGRASSSAHPEPSARAPPSTPASAPRRCMIFAASGAAAAVATSQNGGVPAVVSRAKKTAPHTPDTIPAHPARGLRVSFAGPSSSSAAPAHPSVSAEVHPHTPPLARARTAAATPATARTARSTPEAAPTERGNPRRHAAADSPAPEAAPTERGDTGANSSNTAAVTAPGRNSPRQPNVSSS